MTMLGTLLAKDLRRAWRNPIAFAIHLAVPLLITALIGLAFGGSGRSGGLGRIKLGVVDEDDSSVSKFLRGALNQGEGAKYLEPVFLSRADALQQITDNQLSAVVLLPKDFAADYLTGRQRVTLELIKNPAQSFYPAIVEELLRALATALNAVDRNLRPELREWQALFERTERPSPREVAGLVGRTGDRIEAAKDFVYPPLITYTKAEEKPPEESGPGQGTAGKASKNPVFNIFAFILPGMAALFFLFIADNAMRDLYREQRFRTIQRFRTLRHGLFTFVGAKVAFAVAILMISSLILFGGGSLIFGFDWGNPGALAILTLAYSLFAAGFMAFVTAMAGTEKRADTLNAIVAMGLGLAGGCMFPREQLPAFIGQQVTPLMPPHWFATAVRAAHFGDASVSWVGATALLAGIGLGLVALAAWIFQQRLQMGAAA
jgi:ABC-2 type transport system permease protein